ncbi:hypothetical protein BDV95DRAFT_472314, partial [Massariosphaeria phaeospora]
MESPFDSISDSTDWAPTSLPTFEPLEAALRCEVCKEFYASPVITSCSHTFCSICIRRCISVDGKCPACKTAAQADKLVPNIAVREIVDRFQKARPKALELAKADKADLPESSPQRKRKLDDTDIEDGEPVRQTRSRQTRGRSRRNDGEEEMRIEVPDSDDGGDEEFLLPGTVKCPICRAPMMEAQVFNHLNDCPGEQAKSQGRRNTRSSAKPAFSHPLQNRPKADVPAPTRLPGINYSILKDNALRKKLNDLGIPTWGPKGLLIRRHTEWMHLWNSNCDSSENQKSKSQLLKELNVWETTQGGLSNPKESHVMRKDFDADSHASTHKSQFDDLIANARKKRGAPKEEEKTAEPHLDQPGQNVINDDAEPPSSPQVACPYEGNETALASIRAKVEEANRT